MHVADFTEADLVGHRKRLATLLAIRNDLRERLQHVEADIADIMALEGFAERPDVADVLAALAGVV